MESMTIQSLVDYARKYLESAIITGELSPGQRIKEEEIASRLEISRPPLRQAFEILIAEGLITRKPRRGVFVSEITERDIWEIYTLKASLFELATNLAIDSMTDEGIKKLEDVIQKMEDCVSREPADVTQYQSLNEDFHINILLDISGHKRLRKIMRNLDNQAKRLSYENLMSSKAYLMSSCEYHKLMFGAIKKKDKALSGKLCQEHIFRGMKRLLTRQLNM